MSLEKSLVKEKKELISQIDLIKIMDKVLGLSS